MPNRPPALRAMLLALAVLARSAPCLAEDTYRWLDARGGVHFGTQPPPDARDLERVGSRAGSGSVNVIPSDSANTVPDEAAAPSERAPAQASPPETPGAPGMNPALLEPSRIGGRSQDDWRSEANSLARKIESLEADIEQAETELANAYTLDSSDYYERKVARLHKHLDAAREDLDAFEERARKLEVPPGWLR